MLVILAEDDRQGCRSSVLSSPLVEDPNSRIFHSFLMRLFILFGLAASVAAQSSSPTVSAPSSSASSTVTLTGSAVTVAQDGSGQFTAVGSAVSYAQNNGVATVTVLPGTYSEAITIQGTQTVTIAGPTASSFTDNKVVIAAAATGGVLSFNTQKSTGVTFKNVNITNTAASAGSKAPAVNMSGMNMGFYNCALVSSGTGVYTASFGTTV